jgi:hypothetical protein
MTLNNEEIDKNEIYKLSFSGLPDDQKVIRPLLWRLILGSLSMKPSEWQQTLDQNLDTYEGFKKELIVKP